MTQLALRRLQPSESRELQAWIAERHYLGTAPAGYRAALEFLVGGSRVGGMLLGRPAGRGLDDEGWLELTRMYFLDEAPTNTESRALAMMRRWVRVWMPQVRGLVSYSDPSVGHAGVVYAADGWAAFGRTNNSSKGWKSRPDRAQRGKPSRKVRWVRTP